MRLQLSIRRKCFYGPPCTFHATNSYHSPHVSGSSSRPVAPTNGAQNWPVSCAQKYNVHSHWNHSIGCSKLFTAYHYRLKLSAAETSIANENSYVRAVGKESGTKYNWLVLRAILLSRILGGITSRSATLPTATHYSTAWSVCLSSVCHTRAPCFNHLDAIWQVHFWVRWHIVLDRVPANQGKGRFGGQTPRLKIQLLAAPWGTETRKLATAIAPLAKLLCTC